MISEENKIPKHIGIIMDGNGRWAKKRFLPRVLGHREGVKAVERTLEAAGKFGVKYLTLYAFSTENWGRPEEEVNALMELLSTSLIKYKSKLEKNNVSLRIIGDYEKFPDQVVERLEQVVNDTSKNEGLNLVLALNYSGRWDLKNAIKNISKDTLENKVTIDEIDEELIKKYLSTSSIPDPDLIIRTSGEQRISNFLLWQCAYSELYFTNLLWPEFNEESLKEAIKEYQNRDRRFGEIK